MSADRTPEQRHADLDAWLEDTARVVASTQCRGCVPCQERAKAVARAYLALVSDDLDGA